jgi:hypothetical protein
MRGPQYPESHIFSQVGKIPAERGGLICFLYTGRQAGQGHELSHCQRQNQIYAAKMQSATTFYIEHLAAEFLRDVITRRRHLEWRCCRLCPPSWDDMPTCIFAEFSAWTKLAWHSQGLRYLEQNKFFKLRVEIIF